MCSYPTQVGHFWRHWMRRHYLTRQLDPGDRHIHLAKPVAKHTSVLNGTSGSYSRDNQREKWLSENNMVAPQQRISGEFISLTEEQKYSTEGFSRWKRCFHLLVFGKKLIYSYYRITSWAFENSCPFSNS